MWCHAKVFTPHWIWIQLSCWKYKQSMDSMYFGDFFVLGQHQVVYNGIVEVKANMICCLQYCSTSLRIAHLCLCTALLRCLSFSAPLRPVPNLSSSKLRWKDRRFHIWLLVLLYIELYGWSCPVATEEAQIITLSPPNLTFGGEVFFCFFFFCCTYALVDFE